MSQSQSQGETQPRPAAPPPVQERSGRSPHAILMIVLLIVIIALLLANTRSVEVSWVFGSTRQPLVWIVLVTAILGWLLGIVTSMVFRHRRAQRG
jgi:uncharacterized integral membrane protein